MLTISSHLCIGCGICEEHCPFSAISIDNGYALVNEACTLCGACVEHCPVDAISFPSQKQYIGNLSHWSGILIFCELSGDIVAPVSLELLSAGVDLAHKTQSQLTAIVLGPVSDENVQVIAAHGAEIVYVVDDKRLVSFNDEIYKHVLSTFIQQFRPEIVLAGATAVGRSFFPAVATTLGTGLTADCTELDIRPADKVLLQTRPALGGNIMATIVCERHRPQMATVRPGVMSIKKVDKESVDVVCWPFPEKGFQQRIQVLDTIRTTQATSNLENAEIVVAGGAGLGSEKGADLVYTLAKVMGAGVAASRTAVDNGWFPAEVQVGQTGKNIAPQVYIACGISGAVQHVAGIMASGTVIAINSDKNAAIFDVADYGIVGKIDNILPELIKRLEHKEGTSHDA